MSPTADNVRRALDRLLSSPEMAHSQRMGQFLRFVVEQQLSGEGERLKETVVGMHVFGRAPGYDPKTDPVVRVEARRLRFKLQEYYAGSGSNESIRIDLPKGTYQPRFEQLLPDTPEQGGPERFGRALMVGLGVIACIAFGAWVAAGTAPAIDEEVTPRLLAGHADVTRAPAFSPDGKRIAFTRDRSLQHSEIVIRDTGGGTSRPLHNQVGLDYEPAWSPNASKIAFLRAAERGSHYRLLVADVAGAATTPPREVSDVAVRSPLDWSPGGSEILVADRQNDGEPVAIVAIDLATGKKQKLTSPPAGTYGDIAGRLSPDGKHLAFVRAVSLSVQDVWLAEAATSGSQAKQVTTSKMPVEGLAWTADSKFVVASMVQRGVRSLFRIAATGEGVRRVAEAGLGASYPAIPRRANGLAYQVRFADTNIWTLDLATRQTQVVSQTMQLDTGPQISPDGRRLLWRSAASGSNEVWTARADGRQARALTAMNGPVTGSGRWSPNGASVVFESHPYGNGDLFLIPAAGGAARTLTRDRTNEVLPSYSRDGEWIYYSTDRGGVWEIWRIRAAAGADSEPQRVVGGGAFAAMESPEGGILFYTKREAGGLWSLALQDPSSQEQRITAEVSPNFWGQWAVSRRAVYWAVFDDGLRTIRRLDRASGKIEDLFSLSRQPVQWDSGMSVDPADRWLAWSQLDQVGSDLYLLDGWR